MRTPDVDPNAAILGFDLGAGRFASVRDRCILGLAGRPHDPDLLFYLGMSLEGLGDLSGAAERLTAACAGSPTAERLAQLARVLVLRGREAEAGDRAAQAIGLGLKRPLDLDTVGCVLTRIGRHEAAVPLFAAAVAAAPAQTQFRYNLAVALEYVGDPGAELQHRLLLEQEPTFARSHLALSAIAGPDGASQRAAAIADVLSSAVDPDQVLLLRVALSREQERLGDFNAAFRSLRAGKDLHRSRVRYDRSRDRALFAAIEAAFARDTYFSGPGDPEHAPTFVVGMPRSGTTLVERILGAHPTLKAAGELAAMPVALRVHADGIGRPWPDIQVVRGLEHADPRVIARTYRQHAAVRVGSFVHFIDKLPANFMNVGYIARAFPKAHIICLRRSPMDVVWSNYKHLFARTSALFDYSYDQVDCATYVAGFERLMNFWERTFPERIHVVRYEDLVTRPTQHIGAMLAHLDIPWSDRCLRFFETGPAVATPSALQVRRRIHDSSVGAWKSYAPYLGPAIDALAREGVAPELA